MAAGKNKKPAKAIESTFCRFCGVPDKSMFTFGLGPTVTAEIKDSFCNTHTNYTPKPDALNPYMS